MQAIFEQTYFLTPAECNPQGRMPITLLINRLIEVATLHANMIGIGYASLVEYNETWVLSRVATEMTRYPGVNDNYTIRTWISSISRLFSERDFEILDGDGNTIGHARTVWAVLNTITRSVADISRMEWVKELIPAHRTCPVDKPSRPRALTDYRSEHYRFTYCDIDFNRHVNSSRYIELLLNQWSLDFHDRNRLTRFEIAYMHEALYGQDVEVRFAPEPIPATATETPGAAPTEATRAELIHDSRPLCRALLIFTPRD